MRVVVLGADGALVAETVRLRRRAGDRVAGLVGRPGEAAARAMGDEMLGGVDQVVVVER